MAFIIYIGAALAIGLLIGFVALSVLWLRKKMLQNIRSHTVGLLSVYDDLLDEKSQELSAIQEEISIVESAPAGEQAESTQPHEAERQPDLKPGIMLAAAERAATAPYRDGAMGEVYQTIRQNFSFRVEELLPGLTDQYAAGERAAQQLLNQLSFDTVYNLSTLGPDQQVSVLRECLPPESLILLEGYLQNHRTFNALTFYDDLRSAADSESQKARLFVPEGISVGVPMPAGVEIVADAEICDGFQAELGGKLYDYCITRRELS